MPFQARHVEASKQAQHGACCTAASPSTPPSMLRLCSTNSSWLQGLWKKADSHDSFQILQAQTATRVVC
jgi:hypothetical protein